MLKYSLIGVCVVAAAATSAVAEGWGSVGFIEHSTYQAVNTDGGSAYGGGFPVRLVGVALNDNEDWVDPTSDYDPAVHLWEMGGEAEIYVQAVDLDGAEWDTDPDSSFDDFGGTACWIGQNYGNHIMHQDPSFNYTEAELYAELDRLGMWRPATPLSIDQLVRAGDLVEVRARAGLHYNGKMNVNEQHSKDPSKDYEIVILQKGFGLPSPTPIALSDLKDAGDNFLFDDESPTREFGGELHQAALVKLTNVRFTDVSAWAADGDFNVTDDAGRTLNVHLGLNGSFETMELPGTSLHHDVVGIMDQSDFAGTGGYQLLVMNGSDITLPVILTADFNDDGVIDDIDLTILASHWQQAGGHTEGDANDDGFVDDLDLTALALEWPNGFAPPGAVPEPATLSLMMMLTLSLLRSKRR